MQIHTPQTPPLYNPLIPTIDAAREADQAAKEEFEARLREKDEAKTRKLMEKKYTREELDDIERRKYSNEDEKQTLIPKLRCDNGCCRCRGGGGFWGVLGRDDECRGEAMWCVWL